MTTTYWTASNPRLNADGEALVAVRPSAKEGTDFLAALQRAFAQCGLMRDYKMFAVSKDGPSYIWVKSRYGELGGPPGCATHL